MEKTNKERRGNPDAEFRVMMGDDGKKKIIGYAAVFNKLSVNLGGFREIIKPGAFRNAIKQKQDVRALFNHDPNIILARSSSGTLKLTEDDIGLRYEFTPPDSRPELLESIERGDIKESSFGFIVDSDTWLKDEEERNIRHVNSVKELLDVSPVTYPAYPDTTVAKRNFSSWQKGTDQLQKFKNRLKRL